MENTIDSALEDNKRSASTRPSTDDNKATDNYLAQMRGFEEDRINLAKQSAKTAWKVATGFGVVALAAVAAVAMMMPLKQVEPYLLRVDNATGHTEMVRPLADAKSITYGEVLDKYWLNRFIIERNGYEWETVQNSYNSVKLMSNRQVFGAYSGYITGANSPAKTFGENKVIKINVQGIAFLPATSKEQTLAQVRFTRIVENSEGVEAIGSQPTTWTATVTFDYNGNVKTEKERRINPLGFRVTSYREDRNLTK
ncbi:virB8 family protein [Shewanella septentrionalis]|uniref:Type IV secretion system protein n=1 Tax=Shewanella septentrionalis TaxID=2952223 RepID=A0A9X2WYC1_9GAMM|nr:type IV secretion system protein [Shewanella septentrionalis]MCT7947691.1 type IV secretion system protein [Shewanella septentrionalis]